jgi:hypothetical protein
MTECESCKEKDRIISELQDENVLLKGRVSFLEKENRLLKDRVVLLEEKNKEFEEQIKEIKSASGRGRSRRMNRRSQALR